MQRDMDVIRSIVLAVSDASGPVSSVDGVAKTDFVLHAQLIEEAKLVEAAIMSDGKRPATDAMIWRLTWAGHEFVDSIRDPKIWAKSKQAATYGGGFTLDLLKDLAKGYIKKQIKDKTDIDL